ncbi:unnamed protein product [Rotaria sp. Silwood1]|nr:unnamed protein product [Rotaria sp. Silwood1]CAF4779633.1 unnamed protein product [Rotaria sp. Silwood1]
MKLEYLANEVLHDLFEYFDPIELIHAFEGLNTRFNRLLFIYFRSYRLDFRSISKSNFDLICKQYLPLIIDHVSSLCLSDGGETPQLYEHLTAYCLTIDEFTHLRSLLLQKIDSANIILNITSDCFYLPYLTHLKIVECNFPNEKDPKQLIYNIWHLNNLTHCTLDMTFEWRLSFCGLSIISKSIEYLSIKDYIFSSLELTHLLTLTPYLRHLCITFGESIDIISQRILIAPYLTSLELHFGGSQSTLTNILKSMPNLLHLKLETGSIHLNGNQWKQILINYVPKIKIFRFLIRVLSLKDNHVEEYLEDLLSTFQTPFWMDDHQWYVRCDWPQHTNKIFVLYTLPYCFGDTYVVYQNRWSKTTCPNVRDCNCYDRVKDVFYKGRIDNFALFAICYPKIRRLTLKLPFDVNFWTIIPRLDNLTSLEVIQTQENIRSESQLKELLNRAPRLDFLSVDAISFLLLAQLNITHVSLRRIQLKPYRSRTNRYLNAAQCSILARSLLGLQCEVLVIRIENRQIILDLIHTMYNLRALTFECQDDNSLVHSNDELVEWLRNSLPETYSVTRHRSRLVGIWINR